MTVPDPCSNVPTTARLAALDPRSDALVRRLLVIAARGLPQMFRVGTQEFAFTRTEAPQPLGTSFRYGAIVALGAYFLPEPDQRMIFGGRTAADFVDLLVRRLPGTTNLGDAALVCWAAAQAGHPALPTAMRKLAALDDASPAQYVVETAWLISALTAARDHVDLQKRLGRARARLLGSRHAGSPLFPHATDSRMLPWYRKHVACFADQVYPIQALARLHNSGTDPQACAAAAQCAAAIVALQGDQGEFWWHYDARTGDLVEEYPVYSVHQYAMAPMALFDLSEAGASDDAERHAEAVRRGLTWLERPAGVEPMLQDDDGLVWRKACRSDPYRLVRGIHGVTTRVVPGFRPARRLLRPTAVDRECRPYELGWLLFAWLGGLRSSGGSGVLR